MTFGFYHHFTKNIDLKIMSFYYDDQDNEIGPAPAGPAEYMTLQLLLASKQGADWERCAD